MRTGVRQGFRVTIRADDPGTGGEKHTAVPPSPQRSIQNDPAGRRAEKGNNLRRQNGLVTEG